MIAEETQRLARFHLDIALALFRAREQAGLSVETLAERTGLAIDRILMMEEGDTTSLTEVAQVCDAIGISVASLLPAETDNGLHNGIARAPLKRRPLLTQG